METFQVDKGSLVCLGMTSGIGGYDERTTDVQGKKYILPPEEDSPVFSQSPLPSNKARQRKHHRRFLLLKPEPSHRLSTYRCA
jgi:hypothetical protein